MYFEEAETTLPKNQTDALGLTQSYYKLLDSASIPIPRTPFLKPSHLHPPTYPLTNNTTSSSHIPLSNAIGPRIPPFALALATTTPASGRHKQPDPHFSRMVHPETLLVQKPVLETLQYFFIATPYSKWKNPSPVTSAYSMEFSTTGGRRQENTDYPPKKNRLYRPTTSPNTEGSSHHPSLSLKSKNAQSLAFFPLQCPPSLACSGPLLRRISQAQARLCLQNSVPKSLALLSIGLKQRRAGLVSRTAESTTVKITRRKD